MSEASQAARRIRMDPQDRAAAFKAKVDENRLGDQSGLLAIPDAEGLFAFIPKAILDLYPGIPEALWLESDSEVKRSGGGWYGSWEFKRKEGTGGGVSCEVLRFVIFASEWGNEVQVKAEVVWDMRRRGV